MRGIVSRKLGRGDAMLGSNLNTADGRGTHGHEMLYEVGARTRTHCVCACLVVRSIAIPDLLRSLTSIGHDA